MNSWIGISLGDPSGVGPEVTLKSLAALPDDGTRFLIVGDRGVLDRTLTALSLTLRLADFCSYDTTERITVFNPSLDPLPADLKCGDPKAAEAALVSLREVGERCHRGELNGMVTAPLNKEGIINLGHPSFVGQTEFLSELAGCKQTAMMLLGEDDRNRWLRVVLATTHVPIKGVSDHLTQEKVELAIACAARACQDLGLKRARIAVCGLNPHAGEGGKIGTEEITTIRPAVTAMRQRGFDVSDPMAADALFYYVYRGDYDVVVAMYHDQGLVPLKMVAFERGINWTLGLSFVRTSPDHGTAYDIAGRGIANPLSMMAAIGLAKTLIHNQASSNVIHLLPRNGVVC